MLKYVHLPRELSRSFLLYSSAVAWPDHTDRKSNSREMFLSTRALYRVTSSPSQVGIIEETEETAHTDEPEEELPAQNVYIFSVLAIMQYYTVAIWSFEIKTLNLDIYSCPNSSLSTSLQMRISALSPPLHRLPPCHCWDSAIIMFMRAHRLWRGSLLSSLMKKTEAGTRKKKKKERV